MLVETQHWKYDTTEQNEGEKLEYKEVVGKLFDIVEKMTERLANLEKNRTQTLRDNQ